MTAKALVDRTPNPTDAQIRQAMATVLCRCFAHQRIFQAIRRYVQTSTPQEDGMIPPATRREFLKQSGALIVTFGAAGVVSELEFVAGVAAQGINGNPGTGLDSWIAIAADGRVTAYTGKCELGHGLFTAQTQLIAEELSVPLDRVTLIQCDTALSPDQGTTSGAQSHPANFNTANLALAGATAREALVRLASTRLGVPVDQLSARDGVVSAASDPSKRVSYGDLVGGRTFDIQLDPKARRKHPSTWTVLGTPVKRLDIPAMATGRFEFVHNVRVPGMLHGRVVRPPTVGANLVSVDESSVQRHARARQGGRQEELRRRRRREALAGGAGGGKAEGRVVAGQRIAGAANVPRSACGGARRATRSPSTRATSTAHSRVPRAW